MINRAGSGGAHACVSFKIFSKLLKFSFLCEWQGLDILSRRLYNGCMDETDRTENMMRLKQLGYSHQAIAALYRISRQRVHQIVSGYERNRKSMGHKNGWYSQIRNMVLDRDNGRCQKCQKEKNLIVHHIDGDDRNNDLLNLITLCIECHLRLHRPEAGTRFKTTCHLCGIESQTMALTDGQIICFSCLADKYPERTATLLDYLVKFKLSSSRGILRSQRK